MIGVLYGSRTCSHNSHYVKWGGIETCVAALGLLLYIQIQIAPYIKIIRVLGFRQPLFNQVFVHHHHLQIRFVQKSMMK